nr:MAG TPA: hypothetical protein [Caudoviricetes sp.]
MDACLNDSRPTKTVWFLIPTVSIGHDYLPCQKKKLPL